MSEEAKTGQEKPVSLKLTVKEELAVLVVRLKDHANRQPNALARVHLEIAAEQTRAAQLWAINDEGGAA
jgi:hypothetical protein